jgi:Acetyltransferase (GNAT) domain
MSLVVEVLNRPVLETYGRFIDGCSTSLVYHSPEYIRAMTRLLDCGEPVFFFARRDQEIVGVLPAFLRVEPLGTVLNALPYFGSHGDIIVADRETDPSSVVDAIARQLAEFVVNESVGAMNMVCHPVVPRIPSVAEALGLRAWDQRIGQISRLPESICREEALAAVLDRCHPKTRNLVRKGLRQGFEIRVSNSDEDWALLTEHHQLSMSRIGGNAKCANEFSALRAELSGSDKCRLYVARRGGAFCGALLNLYHRDWVEYFTPVAVIDFRNEQVLSAIIATAMVDAILERRRNWNWGGTWSSQAGVYHFKHGWGAEDHVYRYYGAVRDDRIAKATAQELRLAFPYFYVKPFNQQVIK